VELEDKNKYLLICILTAFCTLNVSAQHSDMSNITILTSQAFHINWYKNVKFVINCA